MTDRDQETRDTQAPADGSRSAERVAIIAKLRPGSHERASQIVAEGAPYALGEAGFLRHSIYVTEDTVVFLFEGPAVEDLIRDLVNDPAQSAAFGVWAPILEGTPAIAQEEFYWEAEPAR